MTTVSLGQSRLADRWGLLLVSTGCLMWTVAVGFVVSWVYSTVMAPRQSRVDDSSVAVTDLDGFPAVFGPALVVAGALVVAAALAPDRFRVIVAALALAVTALAASALAVASARADTALAEAVEQVIRARNALDQPVWLLFGNPGAVNGALAIALLAVVSTVALSPTRDPRIQVLAGIVLGAVAVASPWARPAVPSGEGADLRSQWLWSAGDTGVLLLVALLSMLLVAALALRRASRTALVLLGIGALVLAAGPTVSDIAAELAEVPGLDRHLPHDLGAAPRLAELAMITIASGLWRLSVRVGTGRPAHG